MTELSPAATDTNWASAKSELNKRLTELRSVHENLPSLYSNSVKGWDLDNAYIASAHLRAAIEALKPLTNRRHV
jgi:hypothetical protein